MDTAKAEVLAFAAFLRAMGASERDRELLADQAARRLVTGDYSGHGGPSEAEAETHG